jgi:multidrug efflux pump subunit AcrB
MWIVKLALNRPYTFVVAAILILLLGVSSVATMPTDILPNIDIPVITVVYDYRGLQAQEMEQRITTFNEFIMSTVNDVKSIDSQTVRGYAVLMIYFQPQVHIDAAIAQVGAATQSILFRSRSSTTTASSASGKKYPWFRARCSRRRMAA